MSEHEVVDPIGHQGYSWPLVLISGPAVDCTKLNKDGVSLNVSYRQDHLALFLQSVADKIRKGDYVQARSDLLVHIRELESACVKQVEMNRETIHMAEPLSTSLEKRFE